MSANVHRGWLTGGRGDLAVGVAALLLAAVLLTPGLNAYSLWYDEVMVFNATRALNTPGDLYTIDSEPARIVHPPLFFVLMRGWLAIAGDTDLMLRVPVLLLALLGAAFTYRLAADLAMRAFGGLAAVAILSGAGFVRYYTHMFHNYTLLLAAAAALVFFYLRWQRMRRRKYAAVLALATAALLYTHYYGIFLILALNLYAVLVAIRERRGLRGWLLIQGTVLALYLPWLPVIVRLAAGGYRLSSEYEGVVANSAGSGWAAVQGVFSTLLYDGISVYGLALIVGLVRLCRQALRPLFLLAVLLAGSVMFALFGNTVLQSFSARRLIFVMALIAAALGYGLAALPGLVRWGALALFLLLTPDQPLPPELPGNWFYREALATVAAQAQPGDTLTIAYGGDLDLPPFRYYAARILPAGMPYFTPLDDVTTRLNMLWARERVWGIWHEDHPFTWDEPLLSKQFVEIEQRRFGSMIVSLYAAQGVARPLFPPTSHSVELPQTFGSRFELVNYGVDKLAARPGEAISVWLEWRALAQPDQDWGFFVHLIEDDLTTLHGHADGPPSHLGRATPTRFWPPGESIFDQRTITVELDTPPGQYNLRVGIYSYAEPLRLPVVPGDGGGQDDGLILASITVR